MFFLAHINNEKIKNGKKNITIYIYSVPNEKIS